MQGRFKMEYRLFTIVRYNYRYRYRDYNTGIWLACRANGLMLIFGPIRMASSSISLYDKIFLFIAYFIKRLK